MKKLLALSLIMSSHAFAEGWEKLPPLPEPNGGFIAGEQDGKVVVLGGTNWRDDAKHYLRAVRAFDPDTAQWSTPSRKAPACAYPVVGKVGGRLAWIGGTDGARPVRDIGQFDLATGASLGAAGDLPSSVVLSAGGTIGDDFLVAGGTDDAAELSHLTGAAFAVNAKTSAVTKLPDFPGQPFGIAASAILGGQLFIFGGANWDPAAKTVVNTAEAHAFTLAAREWRKLRPYPFAARGLTAIALDERTIYIGGGYKNDAEGFTDAAFLYDVPGDVYTPAPPLPQRAMVALVHCGGFIYCLGGEDRKKSRTDQCWRIRASKLKD